MRFWFLKICSFDKGRSNLYIKHKKSKLKKIKNFESGKGGCPLKLFTIIYS